MLAFCLLLTLFSLSEGSRVQFNQYEIENIKVLNDQLNIPIDFDEYGYWNDKKDRYLFYSVGLETMKKPLAKPQSLTEFLVGNQSNSASTSKWLNLGFFTLMSQSASQTLRSTARDAEYYMTRYGEMKTASGTLAITSGILGVLGLILAPFGGVALTTASIGLGIASAMTGVPAAIIDITNSQINTSPDFYARVANNQLKMVQEQGKYLAKFLKESYKTMHEESKNLTEKEQHEIEKFLYIYEILNFYQDHEMQNNERGKKTNQFVKGSTAGKAIITSIARSHELDSIRRGYGHFKNALDNPSTLNRHRAKNFVQRIFPQELDIKHWQSSLGDIDIEKEVFLKPEYKETTSDDLKRWDQNARKEVIDDLSKDPWKSKQKAKTRINRKAFQTKVKIPLWSRRIAEKILPSSAISWAKSNAKWIKGALYGLSGLMDSLSIGFGIYDVIIGVQNLQGSGTITDRLREQADLIDASLLGVLSVYEELTDVSADELIQGSKHNIDLLTGIELHTCNQYWGGSTYGINATLTSNSRTCETQGLMEYQLMHRGEWMDYNGFILGNCNHFSLEEDEDINFSIKNSGTDGMCLEDVNLKTNFDPAPKFTCPIEDPGVWIALDYDYDDPPKGYAYVHSSKCNIIPGISQLKIVVPDVVRAGTDGTIRMNFIFAKGKACSTGILDNKHDDLNRGSTSIFQANTLGDCFDLSVQEDDLIKDDDDGRKYVLLEAINEGSDGLSMSAIDFYVNLNDKSERFKCDIPPHGIRIDYSRHKVKCYQVFETFDSRAIHAIQIHPKDGVYAYSLVLRICQDYFSTVCCTTSAFNHVYGGYTMSKEGSLLRDCEGFMIKNDEYSVYIVEENGARSQASDYIQAIDVYSSRFKFFTPMDTCHLNSFSYCKIPNEFQVNSLRFGVCDKVHAGTDSAISLEICSRGNCCNSGILDKSINDFERGDWMEFRSHELSWECRDFPISTSDLRVSIINAGYDALCIDRFQILTDGDSTTVLNCYVPLKEDFWVESEKLVVTCD